MSASVSSASVNRPVCLWASASRYRTSRFSGNDLRSNAAAEAASPKRRAWTNPRIICTSSSTLAAAAGCGVTVMASSKEGAGRAHDEKGRTSLSAPALYRDGGPLRFVLLELEPDLYAK